jgi:DNA-binding CsgD family transcriptional regulator
MGIRNVLVESERTAGTFSRGGIADVTTQPLRTAGGPKKPLTLPAASVAAKKPNRTSSRGSVTALDHESRPAETDSEEASQLNLLIRRLIQDARPPRSLADTSFPDEGFERSIVFDVEVDGQRYRLVQSQAKPRSVEPHAAPLSPREREIARMVAKGYPNKTIAAVLEISSWTVNTYLRRMFAKLNVGSRAAMVAKLMKEN